MGDFKKRLSSVLGILLVAMTFLSYAPVKATEPNANVTFVGVEHSPLVIGDSQTFYLSSTGAEKVQYRVFQNKIGTDNWEELTEGYTDSKNANAITTVNGSTKYELGKYKLSVWVKKADVEGKFKNKNGSYDSYYITYLNCVSKDDNNRVYTNGDMDVEKDNYVVGETVKVSGIKDISGMKDPYTYKLHIYDVNSNEWKFDNEAYRKDLSFVADKPGTYVLDVWAMSSNSTLWSKEAKLNGRIYEAWKLKVITVNEKVEPIEIDIVEKGVEYGSQDAKKPKEISKNVNIMADDVILKNVNVNGEVTVTGDNATLDNTNIKGTLVLNPGEKGTVNLNNVTANTIEVLSGAENSIHFNNVNGKILNIKSKNLKEVVRVELKGITNFEKTTVRSNVILEVMKGSFGNVEVLESQAKTENLVEFRGNFEKSITVKTNATLKTAKDAKVSKIDLQPQNNEKITLNGTFDEVEVNNKAIVSTTENTKVQKITTNASGVTLEMEKGAVITTLDQKSNAITRTGNGTVTTVLNPPPVPQVPSGGNGNVTPTPISVTSVSLDKTTANLNVAGVLELTATINPIDATNKKVTWSTSNPAVATVTGTGTSAEVKAIAAGTATITVTTEDGSKTATCEITVPTEVINVISVSLNKNASDLKVGETLDLIASINPTDATNKNVVWSTSNPAVATVTGTGTSAEVKAIGAGTATITVTTEDGSKTATCEITVPTEVINVISVSLNKNASDLKVGETLDLLATINPIDATNKNVVWSTSNPAVATVTGTGTSAEVKAIGAGTATITVTTEDGSKAATCIVTVPTPTIPVTEVVLSKATANLIVAELLELTATISPTNATNKNVTWTSSNEAVATVIGSTGAKATVEAMGAGTATITVKTVDGGYTATCIVTVTESIGELGAVVNVDKKNINVVVNNLNIKNQAVTIKLYNKSNETIVFLDQKTADSEGKVTFGTVLNVGEYHGLVKAITYNGFLTTELDFKVIEGVTGVSLDMISTNMLVGEEGTLRATITPSNAVNKNLTWTSSNNEVVTVTSTVEGEAKITAIGAGTAVITVKTEDGDYTATCLVTVQSPANSVTGVILSKTTANLILAELLELTATISPINATNKNVIWTSSNEAVATVTGTGTSAEVKAIGVGTATITVRTVDGGYTATCIVTVTESIGELGAVVSVDKNNVNVSIDNISVKNQAVTITLYNKLNETLVFLDQKTANSDGRVTFETTLDAGEYYGLVKAATSNGFLTSELDFKVNASVTAVSLDVTSANMLVGEVGTLIATITPSNAVNKNLTWTTSNNEVVTVTSNANGTAKITAMGAGTATITVKTEDGGFTATCEITVSESIGELGAVVNVDKYNVNVSVDNIKAKDQEVTIILYNKLDETMVFIDQKTADSEGKVTFDTTLDAGEYYGFVKASEASLISTLDFKVIARVTGVSLDITSATMLVGEEGTLRATITPSNVVNKNLTWTSSNNEVVTVTSTVDGEAKIKAIAAGTATITVKTEDGSYTATCKITVSENIAELGAVVSVDSNKVSISVVNTNVKNQEITITLYNKADESLAFLDQAVANSEGKVSFNTVLDIGEYYGFVKCTEANLLTEVEFAITRVTVDKLVKGISDFVNEQDTLKTYMTFGQYNAIGESRTLDITVLKKDSTLEDMFALKETANLTLSEKLVLRNLIYSVTNLDITVNADYLNVYLSNKLAQTEYKDYTKEELIDLFYTMDYATFLPLFNSLTWLNEEVDVVVEGKVVKNITIDVTGTAVEIYNNVNNKKVTRDNIRKALGLAGTENSSNMTLGDFVGTYVITMEDGTTFTTKIK